MEGRGSRWLNNIPSPSLLRILSYEITIDIFVFLGLYQLYNKFVLQEYLYSIDGVISEFEPSNGQTSKIRVTVSVVTHSHLHAEVAESISAASSAQSTLYHIPPHIVNRLQQEISTVLLQNGVPGTSRRILFPSRPDSSSPGPTC